MKQKFISILAILIITALSACGPAPTPALTTADIKHCHRGRVGGGYIDTSRNTDFHSHVNGIPPTETSTQLLPHSQPFPRCK